MTDHMQLQRKTVGQSVDMPTSVISAAPVSAPTTTPQLTPEPPAQTESATEQTPEQEPQSQSPLNYDFGRLPIFAKLSISQPNDPYEQEADRVAEQVMRMPDHNPAPAPSVQGFAGHDFSQIALSPQLEPIVQRKCAACEEEDEKLMRKENGESIGDMGSLESKLADRQSGGEPLSDDIRAFMEPRFGFDFSQVRVHTDSDAAEMNEAIHAQAFAHGNDIYFNTGRYAPETQDGKQLLAHELTHTVQQTGGKLPPLATPEIEPQSSKIKQQSQYTSTETNRSETNRPSIQSSLMLWRMVQTKTKLHLMRNEEAKMEEIQEQSIGIQTPDVQAKCSECEEGTLQRQKVTPITSKDKTIQAAPNPLDSIVGAGEDAGRWLLDREEDAVELVGEGVEQIGEGLEDIANWTGDQFTNLVAQVSPELADFIRNNPIETIKTKVEDGIQSWLDGLFDGFDISSVIDDFTGRFDEMFAMARAFLSGDPESCAAVAEKLNSMTEFVRGVMDSPAIQAMQDAIATVSDIFQRVVDGFVAPVFDTLMNLVGGALSAVVDFAQDIWQWTEPVRRFIGGALSGAWNWVKERLGFSTGEGDSEGGIVKWVKDKASEAWNFIKEKFAPVIEPIKKVLLVVVAISPVGWIAGAIKYGPQLIEMAKWLWNNRDNPDIVKSAHEEMGHTILPQLLSASQGFGDGLQNAVNSLIGTVTGFGKELLNVLGSIVNIPLLSMAKGLVQTVSDHIQTFIVWSQKTFQSVVQSVVRFAKSVKEKIEPYISVLSSLGMALINPASIPLVIAGAAWRLLPECYKGPIIDFLLDTLIEILSGMPDFPFFGLLWPLLKTGVLGFLRGLRKQSTEVKVAISNKIAKIISGGSPAFMLGFVKGLLKGIWEGIADPFLLIYDGFTAINDFKDWLTRSDTEARNPSGNQTNQPSDEAGETAQSPQPDQVDNSSDPSRRPDQSEDASDGRADRGRGGFGQEVMQEASQNVLEVIVDRLLSMASELEPPTQDVTGNFMGAMQEVFKGAGETMTFEDFVQMLGEIKQSIMNAIEEAGGRLANQVCEFMMQDEAEGKIGEGAGYLAGTIVFEVVLAILTAGAGTAAKAVVRVARQITRVLDRQGDAMRMVSHSMKTLGKHLDDILGSLRKLVSKAGGKAEDVMKRMGVIGDILRRYGDEFLELLTGGVPIPGGRRDTDDVIPDRDRSPGRDADGAPHQDGDDAREGDRDPATPQPDRGDELDGQRPSDENAPVGEPDQQRPGDHENNPNSTPDSTTDSPRDEYDNRDPAAPQRDGTDQRDPQRDGDTPDQQRLRDRNNDPDSTPDSNRDPNAENGDRRPDDDRTDDEIANSELYHQRLIREAVAELEEGEPEDYDTVREETEAKARQIEIDYTRRLKRGIKLRVYFQNAEADLKDEKLDFKVVIAPNDSEGTGRRDIIDIKKKLARIIFESKDVGKVEEKICELEEKYNLSIEWVNLGRKTVEITANNRKRSKIIHVDPEDHNSELILSSQTKSRSPGLNLSESVKYKSGTIKTPSGNHIVGQEMTAERLSPDNLKGAKTTDKSLWKVRQHLPTAIRYWTGVESAKRRKNLSVGEEENLNKQRKEQENKLERLKYDRTMIEHLLREAIARSEKKKMQKIYSEIQIDIRNTEKEISKIVKKLPIKLPVYADLDEEHRRDINDEELSKVIGIREDILYIAGHLLNFNLGGPNDDRNLYPITQEANGEHSEKVEEKVKRWSEVERYWVSYSVIVKEASNQPIFQPILFKGQVPKKRAMTVDADFVCKAYVLDVTGQPIQSSEISETIHSKFPEFKGELITDAAAQNAQEDSSSQDSQEDVESPDNLPWTPQPGENPAIELPNFKITELPSQT